MLPSGARLFMVAEIVYTIFIVYFRILLMIGGSAVAVYSVPQILRERKLAIMMLRKVFFVLTLCSFIASTLTCRGTLARAIKYPSGVNY